MVGERAFVDVGQGFPPAIEQLHRVITIGDPRHAHLGTTVLIDGQPGFRIGNVEIGIGPVNRTGLSVHQVIPGHALLKIQLLLAHDEQTPEQVDVGIADLLVSEGRW
ncbi:hypothetical protein D3C73_954440 [compost metagenome]